MADPIFFGIFDAAGNPAPAAVPTWLGFFDHQTLASRTAPAFLNRGNGQHGFEPAAGDEAVGCIGLIDAGAGFFFEGGGRYLAVTVPEAAQFEAFVLVDAAGVPWTGAAPDFDSYEGRAGALSPEPTIGNPVAGLFTFAPSASDIAAGVSYRIDAPAGASPAFLFGSATAPTTGPYSPPSSGVYPADALAQLLAGAIALPDPPGGDPVTLVYAADGNLILGPVRPVAEVPQLAVFVLQAGGAAPTPYMGSSGESFHVSRVQVTVRSAINGFSQAEALARALHARAHLNTPPGYTYALAGESDPLYLGTDDDGAHRFSFNVDLGHRR